MSEIKQAVASGLEIFDEGAAQFAAMWVGDRDLSRTGLAKAAYFAGAATGMEVMREVIAATKQHPREDPSPGRSPAQMRQLVAFTSKSGEQKFATMNDLRVILRTCTDWPPARALAEGRAACNCCGEMVTTVLDRNGLQFCIPCVTEAQLPPGEA